MKKKLLTSLAFATMLKLTSVAQCGNPPAITVSGATASCGTALSVTLTAPSNEFVEIQNVNVPGVDPLTEYPGRSEALAFSIGCKDYTGSGVYFDVNAVSGTGETALKDFWEYDPLTNIWSQKANIPVARRGGIGFAIGNFGYVGGGAATGGTYLNDFWRYDQAGNSWTSRANIPVARWLAASASNGALGFIMGGFEDQNVDPTNTAFSKLFFNITKKPVLVRGVI